MVNTLFASHLIDTKGRRAPAEQMRSTTEIESISHIIEENGVRLRLNIVDTPGYGDQINNDRCWDPIVKYIKDQHSAFLRRELTATREKYIQDTRIHCCLFFIAPTGHQLKPLDVAVLKKLSDVVNIVPVIAKADGLTMDERLAFKDRIKQEFAAHGLKIYPYESDDMDPDERALNEAVGSLVPFAVVGSEQTIHINGRDVPARVHKWGTINVEDERQSEFIYLRKFLTETHLQDLIETTAQVHYESFRSKQLLALKEQSAAMSQGGQRNVSTGYSRN